MGDKLFLQGKPLSYMLVTMGSGDVWDNKGNRIDAGISRPMSLTCANGASVNGKLEFRDQNWVIGQVQKAFADSDYMPTEVELPGESPLAHLCRCKGLSR